MKLNTFEIHDLQEVGEWLEDCVINCQNEEIVEVAQYILQQYLNSENS